MFKDVDYVVTQVRYDDENTHIELLKVLKILKNRKDVEESNMTRNSVLNLIEQGYIFYTAYFYKENGVDQIREGAKIIPIHISDTVFLKTEKNEIEEDNLGELPTF